jgi:hypothetical protein
LKLLVTPHSLYGKNRDPKQFTIGHVKKKMQSRTNIFKADQNHLERKERGLGDDLITEIKIKMNLTQWLPNENVCIL